MPDEDQDYLEWLAAAPKGVRWDRAQEMYELYQEKRREQAAAVANRLLGISPGMRLCPNCNRDGGGCNWCFGTGEINA